MIVGMLFNDTRCYDGIIDVLTYYEMVCVPSLCRVSVTIVCYFIEHF